MSNRFKKAAERAAKATDAKYASEISSITGLKDNQIKRLFPTRNDKDKLLQLLAIVNAATDENEKTVKLKENFDTLAGTVVRLIKLLV